MKGLLVKDFRLMAVQKRFFFVLTFISICLIIFGNDPAFPIGFYPVIMSLFTISTISYDEFDNGYSFLFTLPVTRKNYVAEKYLFGFIVALLSCIFISIFSFIHMYAAKTAVFSEFIITVMLIIPMTYIIQSIMIPFQLKYGSEKGRIAIIVSFVGVALILIIIKKISGMLGINLFWIYEMFASMDIYAFTGLVYLIALIVFLISITVSINIMNKREF